MGTKIGIQLYTLREHLRTNEDKIKTLKKIKEIGYDLAELACFDDVEAIEAKKMLDDSGIKPIAAHVGLGLLKSDLSSVIKRNKVFGFKYIVCPWLDEPFQSYEGFMATAKEFIEINKTLNSEGFSLVYHNHGMEFEKFNGKLGLDIFFDETSKNELLFELDTFWVQSGGSDPVAWCKKLKDRLPILHCKDSGVKKDKTIMMEVGEGNLNWKAIFSAAEESGTEFYIIEEDACYRDVFDSIETSLKNVKAMGIK